MLPKPRPLLCYVTDRLALRAAPAEELRALLERIRRAVAAGVDLVQIREKDLSGRALVELAREAVAACGAWSRAAAQGIATRIVVNDRLDVALAAGAAGVHLGGASLPVAAVHEWCTSHAPGGFLIGSSCHSLDEASAAAAAGADYIIFGPVFATPSKVRYGPPLGVEALREACRAAPIPVLGIGGITTENAAECLAAGPGGIGARAAGIAAIRLFQQAADVAAVVARLRAAR